MCARIGSRIQHLHPIFSPGQTSRQPPAGSRLQPGSGQVPAGFSPALFGAGGVSGLQGCAHSEAVPGERASGRILCVALRRGVGGFKNSNPRACNHHVGMLQLTLTLEWILEQVSWFRQTPY